MLSGYASGFTSHCLDKEIYFIEEQCRAKEDQICSAVGLEKQTWGETITPHLSYFEPGDIQARVELLSERLRQKAVLIDEQRKKTLDAIFNFLSVQKYEVYHIYEFLTLQKELHPMTHLY